jgi:hypothetical protein
MYRASGALFKTIDTVVEEKPLSFATSRMVTIAALAPEQRTAAVPQKSQDLFSEFAVPA